MNFSPVLSYSYAKGEKNAQKFVQEVLEACITALLWRPFPTVWSRPILVKAEVNKRPVASDTTADIFSY